MKLTQRNAAKVAFLMAVGLAASSAMAATTGAEFQALANMLKGWAEGYLGLALGLAAFVVGLAVGLMKQTIMPCLVGLGVALAATLGPGIIQSMFTAVI